MKSRPPLFFHSLLLVTLLSGLPAALATEPEWAQMIETDTLTPLEVETLKKEKLLVSGQEIRQVFGPYVMMTLPVFITSDTVLSGFNGLIQESIRFLDLRQKMNLHLLLGTLQSRLTDRMEGYRGIYGKTAMTEAGLLRARMLLAVGQHLLGDADAVPTDLRAAARADAERLAQEEGVHFPTWLGQPTPAFLGLDVASFKPTAFYAQDENLQRIFRTLTWLQSVPLRVQDDISLISISALANALEGEDGSSHDSDRSMLTHLQTYAQFFGSGGSLGLVQLSGMFLFRGDHQAPSPWAAVSLKERREYILKVLESQLGTIQSNSLLSAQLGLPTVRVLPSSEMPDHRYFHATGSMPVTEVPMGRGLEVAAALGSDTARQELTRSLGARSVKERLELAQAAAFQAALTPPREIQQDLFTEPAPPPGTEPPPPPKPQYGPPSDLTNWADESSFYQRYLSCLSALTDPAEPEAAALFSSQAWRAKSCQTVLTGWAHIRHTAALHARHEVYALCAAPNEPGYVEPDPLFFEMLGNLAEQWHRAFKDRQMFQSSAPEMIPRIQADLDRMQAPENTQENEALASARERILTAPWPEHLRPPEWAPFPLEFLPPTDKASEESRQQKQEDQEKAHIQKVIEWQVSLRQWLEPQLQAGQVPVDLYLHYEKEHRKLNERWQGFIVLCRQLEAIAHKQLRGRPLSDAQREFMFEYGGLLARLMGYEGSTYLEPRDDAPVCTQLLHDPLSGTRRHVGLGRPRLFYILYPTPNGEVLLRGAVNTYDERDSMEPLTDEAWREPQQKQATPTPEWLRPISPSPSRPLKRHDW